MRLGMRQRTFPALAAGALLLIGACVDELDVLAPTVPVADVEVTPSATSLVIGDTARLTAVARDSAGNALADRTVAWSSSDPGVATVSASGLVRAAAPGSTTITATSEGASDTSEVSVVAPSPAPVATVDVTPAARNLTVGDTAHLTAVTRDAAGNLLTGRIVAWSSSNEGVASVDGSGVVTAVGAGSASIRATSEGKTGTSQVTVGAPPPAPVATVEVSPGAKSLTVGETVQLTAVTKDAEGNVLTGRTVTWSSSSTGVATVGSTGLVTAVGEGSATIRATSEGQSGTSAITVSPPAPTPVATVEVTPAGMTLVVGDTARLTAVTRDAEGNVLTGRTITWSSENEAVATVGSTGLVTAVGEGSTLVRATSEGRSGASAILVTPPPPAPVDTVEVVPDATTLAVGDTVTLTAVVKDAEGNELGDRTVVWSSSNETVATVSAAGLVTAVGEGSATIRATSEGRTGTSQITVEPPPPS